MKQGRIVTSTALVQAFVNRPAIESAVREVEKTFAEQIAYIRYSFEDNFLGEPSIRFHILVRDEAAPIELLEPFVRPISIALLNAARTDENGLHPYFRFRSVSEQARVQDPEWK